MNGSENIHALSEAHLGKTALPTLMCLMAITNIKFVSLRTSDPVDKIGCRASKKKKNSMSENGMGSRISFAKSFISSYLLPKLT